jgi:CubicO group peptidase (beta-lactamase class C family)
LLYAQDGTWAGERILPEGWVKASIQPLNVAPLGEYGYQVWLNAGSPMGSANRRFPSLPADLYYLSGHEDQYVFVVPSRKLVVVRLGQTGGDGWFDTQGFMRGILEVLPGN